MGRKENEMAAENNVITKADIQYAREVDFINRFNAGLISLMTVLGIVRPIPKQAGTVLKAYVADGTLENGYVPEGEIIPLSNFKVKPVTFREIMLQKYRKASTGEAIVGGSYSQAVTKQHYMNWHVLQALKRLCQLNWKLLILQAWSKAHLPAKGLGINSWATSYQQMRLFMLFVALKTMTLCM